MNNLIPIENITMHDIFKEVFIRMIDPETTMVVNMDKYFKDPKTLRKWIVDQYYIDMTDPGPEDLKRFAKVQEINLSSDAGPSKFVANIKVGMGDAKIEITDISPVNSLTVVLIYDLRRGSLSLTAYDEVSVTKLKELGELPCWMFEESNQSYKQLLEAPRRCIGSLSETYNRFSTNVTREASIESGFATTLKSLPNLGEFDETFKYMMYAIYVQLNVDRPKFPVN